jgi:hypothetical protein
MSTHYFSCSGGPGAVLTNRAHGHVMLNLYFCILWDLQVTKCIPVRPRCEMSTHYFHVRVGLVQFP